MAKVLVGKKGFVSVLEVRKPKDSEYNPRDITVAELSEAYTSIPGATSSLNFAYPQYVRRLLSEGRLTAIRVAIKGGSKWFIERAGIERYRDSTARSAMVRNYVLKIRKESEDAVRSALEGLGIEYSLTLSYDPKESGEEKDGAEG